MAEIDNVRTILAKLRTVFGADNIATRTTNYGRTEVVAISFEGLSYQYRLAGDEWYGLPLVTETNVMKMIQ